MLHAVTLVSLLAAQSSDDVLLCTSAGDCPPGAFCEDGVCVVAEEPRPRKKRVQRRRRARVRDPDRCYRGDCSTGEECYRGSCGPPVPSSGLGLTISGGVVTGVSLLFFANAAICQLDEDQPSRDQNVCTAVTASIGAVAFAVGVPMLIIGVIQRARFKEWVRQYHPHLAVAPVPSGGVASLGFSF